MPARRQLILATLAMPALAQTDSQRIVVNFPPGAALDGVARLIAEYAMREGRGTVIVENRPGAAGNIGAAVVARARPDQRMLLATIDTPLTVNPLLYRDLGFDPVRDFSPLAIIGTFSLVLLAHPSAPFRDLAGLIAHARREPTFYTSAGAGSPGHLAMEHLRQMAGLPAGALENVPQRGNAEAVTALVSGTAPVGFLAIGGGPDLVRSGRLRALGSSGTARHPALPEVPAVTETLPGFEVRIANLLLATPATAPGAQVAWSALAQAALATPEAAARFATWGLDPGSVAGSAEAIAFIEASRARWARVVRDAGMRVE